MPKTFSHVKTIFMQDITIFGNAYFASYFYWLGEAREAFLKELVGDPALFFASGVKLVTRSSSLVYKNEVNLLDVVRIVVVPEKVSVTTVDLRFIFTKNGSDHIIAEGHQQIGFVGKDGHPIPIPIEFVTNGKIFISQDQEQKIDELERKIRWVRENSLLI